MQPEKMRQQSSFRNTLLLKAIVEVFMKYRNDITQDYLKDRLHYCPESGIFIWINHTYKRRNGSIAGSIDNCGAIKIAINRKRYLAHRLAWLYMTGEWPKDYIDHINLNRADNRFCNLREATPSENLCNRPKYKNNKSGVKGVYFHKASKKWGVTISKDNKQMHIGLYKDLDKAIKVRRIAANDFHEDFKNETY